MSPDETSAAPRSMPGPGAVPSPSGTSLAAVIDSAIMAIRAVADTIKEKDDALGLVRSQLASVEDGAQVQAKELAVATATVAGLTHTIVTLQSDLDAARSDNEELTARLKAREDELNEIQSNLAELKEALETGPIAEMIKSILAARAAVGASESSAPGEPAQAPGDVPAPQPEAPEAVAGGSDIPSDGSAPAASAPDTTT